MSGARGSMTMRCTIERNSVSVLVDDYNNPVPAEFVPLAADVPCRAWVKAGRTIIDGEKSVVIEDRRVLLPLTTDVTEADRISSITDRLGNAIFGPVRIDHIGTTKDHLELLVTEVA